MAEWWNLDQVMIWAQTRDLDLVALAAGDAAGRKPRQLTFADVMLPGDDEDPDESRIALSRAGLVYMLDTGKLAARDAEDESAPYPLDIPFSNYHCVIVDKDRIADPCLALRSAAYPYRWRYVLIASDDAQLQFPPKAPAEMQADLAAMLAATEPPTPEPIDEALPLQGDEEGRVGKMQAVMNYLDQHYPAGLPSAAREHGKRSEIFRTIQEALKSGPDGPLDFSTVRKAAVRWEESRRGKRE